MEDNINSNQNKVNIEKSKKEEKGKTKYQQLEIPGTIKIGNYSYVYKDQNKAYKNIFFYRCQKSNCRITIEIDRENINKISEQKKNVEIIFKQKKEYKCEIKNQEKTEKVSNYMTEDQIVQKIKLILKEDPLKPLSYQQIKLHENDIYMNNEKIKSILYNIRDSIFLKDDEYLSNINNIAINFDDKIPNSKNLPFWLNNTKFFNPIKNRIEQYIIFSSKFQIKFLIDATHIFIDATFKIAPKNFYQILNILAHNDKTKITIPVAFILMTNKSY